MNFTRKITNIMTNMFNNTLYANEAQSDTSDNKKSKYLNKQDKSNNNSDIKCAKIKHEATHGSILIIDTKKYTSTDIVTMEDIIKNKIIRIEVCNIKNMNILINILSNVQISNIFQLHMESCEFTLINLIEIIEIIKKIYYSPNISLVNCQLLENANKNMQIKKMIMSDDYNIRNTILKICPKANISIQFNKTKQLNDVNKDLGEMLSGLLNQISGAQTEESEEAGLPPIMSGLMPGFEKPKTNNNNDESNKSIYLRTTVQGQIDALNIIMNDISVSQSNREMAKTLYNNNKLNSKNPNQSHLQQFDKDKLEIISKMVKNSGSIMVELSRDVSPARINTLITYVKDKLTKTLIRIYDNVNPYADSNIKTKIIKQSIDVMLSNKVNSREKKMVICGSPGNGKTTGLITQGWFIILRDVLNQKLKEYNQHSNYESYTKYIDKILNDIVLEIEKLISIGRKFHNNPNEYCMYYVALIQCQSFQEMMDLQGANQTFSGSNIGMFMRTFIDSSGQNFAKLHSVLKDNISEFPLASSVLLHPHYIIGYKAIILDELEKTPKKNGDMQVMNAFTKLLEYNKLLNIFLAVEFEFEGLITGTANSVDALPTHIKDRCEIITPAVFSPEVRKNILQYVINKMLESQSWELENFDNDRFVLKHSKNNINKSVKLTESVINRLSDRLLESDKGSVRKLVDNASKLTRAIIEKIVNSTTYSESNPFVIDDNILVQLLPDILLSPNLNIVQDENKIYSFLTAYTNFNKEELKVVKILVSLLRTEHTHVESFLLTSFYTSDKHKDHAASTTCYNLVKTVLDVTYNKLNKLASSHEGQEYLISIPKLKDDFSSTLSEIRRVIVSVGLGYEDLSTHNIGNIALLIVLLLIASKEQFITPINTMIVGSVDIAGSIIIDPQYDNSISAKLASIQGSSNKDKIYVLLPTQSFKNDITSYIVRNFSNMNVEIYDINDIIGLINVTYALSIINNTDIKQVSQELRNKAIAFLNKHKIDHKSMIDKIQNARNIK